LKTDGRDRDLAGRRVVMLKWMVALGSVVLLGAQEKGQNPDLKYLPNWGISVMRPPKPKNEEWDLKDSAGKFRSQLCVTHKVDDVSIEFLIQEPATGMSAYDPKAAGEALFKDLSESPAFKDGKKRAPIKAAKLPGNAAGGVQTWYLEMEFKDADGKTTEFRTWSFIGKENQCLYRIVLITAEGMHTKYQREINFIMSTIRLYKIK
jgi:hypothetical protein